MPKVSIIVPVYNVEKYLRECIDSIIAQTLEDIEIICVDDGSPDNCGEIIDEYAKKDSRIVAIHKENGGYGSAINKGLDIAKGEYIGIVESDDWIEPDMYERLYYQANKTGADVIKGCYYRYNNNTKTKKLDNYLYNLAKSSEVFTLEKNAKILLAFASIWSAIYKTSWLKKEGIRVVEDIKPYEDQPFMAETLSKASSIAYASNAYYNYRCEVDTSTTKTLKPSIKNYILQKDQIRNIFIKNKVFNKNVMEHYWFGAYLGGMDWFSKPNNKYRHDFYILMQNLFRKAFEDGCEFIYFSKNQKKEFQRVTKLPFILFSLKLNLNKFFKYLYKKEKNGNKRKLTILGIKIKYTKKTKPIDAINTRVINLEKQLTNIENLLRLSIKPNQLPKAQGRLRIQQLASLALLKTLVPFLEKNNIEYWIEFGTLLGAVRHKGFIPWDDDIDIAVRRKDYEKLKKILPEFCKNDYSYSDGELLRVFYKNTSAQVDIFPFDSGYSEELPPENEYKRITKKLDALFKSLPIDCSNFRISSLPEAIKRKFPEINKNEVLNNKPAIDKGFLYLAFHCLAWKRVLYKYDDMFPLKKIEFEGEIFKCPNNVEKHLHDYWGDYMLLPKNCSSHHNEMTKAMECYDNIKDMINLINKENLTIGNDK